MKLCLPLLVISSVLLTAAVLPSVGADAIECNRPNEHYECGSACQTKCTTLGEDCPIVNAKCNDACYCNEGYARDAQDNCIPVDECED